MFKSLIKLFFGFLISLIILLILLVVFLPSFISSNPVKNMVLDRVNRSPEVTVMMDTWSLGWKTPFTINNLSVKSISSGADIQISEVKTTRGLLDLLIDHTDLGQVDLIAPRITVPEPEPETNETHKTTSASKTTSTTTSKPAGTHTTTLPAALPDLKLTFNMQDAYLALARRDGSTQVIFHDLDARFTADDANTPILFNLSGEGGSGIGSVKGNGKIDLGNRASFDPSQIKMTGSLSIPKMDLEPVTTFLSSLLDTPVFHGTLKLTADGTAQPNGAGKATAQLVINDFKAGLPEASEMAQLGNLFITASASTSQDKTTTIKAGLRSASANGSISGSVDDQGKGLFTIVGTADLLEVDRLGHATGFIQPGTAMSGALKLHATLDLNEAATTIQFDGTELVNTALKIKDKRLFENSIKLSGAVVHTKQTIQLEEITIATSAGHLTIPKGSITEEQEISVQAQATISLAKLDQFYGRFLGIPTDLKPKGSAQCILTLNGNLDDETRITIDNTIADLELQLNQTNQLSESRVEASIDLVMLPESTFRLEQLDILSEPFVAKVKGERNEHTTRLEGLFGPNFNRLTDYLNQGAGIPVKISGNNQNPINLEFQQDGEQSLIESAKLDTSITAESLIGYGMNITNLLIPITMSNGIAIADISGGVNQGLLKAEPSINFKPLGKVITLPDQSRLLEQVVLDHALSDGLLSKLHPAFTGVTAIDGMLTLDMNHFRWPLDKELQNQAVFSGTMLMTNLSYGASGTVLKLLELMQVRERTVYLGQRSIDFTCRNGRITCSPLKMKVGEHQIVLSGTMGLDRSLDYVAEIPLTRELIGRSGQQALGENVVVKVPIQGTADNPRIDDSSIAAALKSVSGQALRNVIEKEGAKYLKKLFE